MPNVVTEAYTDYAQMFAKSAFQFGRDDGSWGQVVVQPNADGIHSVSQFFDNALIATSGEMMEVRDGWVFNSGFRQPDGSVVRISTIAEILSDQTGSHDITVVGGPQHYALNDIPGYQYSIWTHAHFISPEGKIVGEYSHSQERYPAADFTNPFWLGYGQKTRRCIGHHEEWTDDGGGVWSLKIKRFAHLAKGAGLWHVQDEMSPISFGMRLNWSYA